MRAWRSFWRDTKGRIALILFACITFVSLCANFLANDKPLFISYQGEWYFPIITTLPESTFGNATAGPTNYQDKHIQHTILAADGIILFPPIAFSADTIDYYNTSNFPSPPDAVHWLGTDDQGRDILVRLLYGYRTSILFALLLTIGSSVVGVIIGLAQGYYGGVVDLLGQRLIEIWSGIPVLFLLILLSASVLINFWLLLFLMLLFSWTELVHFVRAETLKVRNYEYVMATQALGASDMRVMLSHILPNALVSALSMLPFVFTAAITTLTALDFLGFGLPPGEPSLGDIINQAKENLHAPWIAWSIFVALTLLLALMLFIGEALRNALHPHYAQDV